jgi:hypothetical protein
MNQGWLRKTQLVRSTTYKQANKVGLINNNSTRAFIAHGISLIPSNELKSFEKV